jgi:hypothetical protein
MGRIGRRAVFFAVIAVVCLLMVWPTPPDLRYVPYALAGLATFWAVMVGLDDLFAPVRPRRRAAERLIKRGVISAPPVTMEAGSPLRPPPAQVPRAERTEAASTKTDA